MHIDLNTKSLNGKYEFQPGRLYAVTDVTGISHDMGVAVFTIRTTDDVFGPYVVVPVDITATDDLIIDPGFDTLIAALANPSTDAVHITFSEDGYVTLVGDPRPTAELELPPLPDKAEGPAVLGTAGKMSADSRRALFE